MKIKSIIRVSFKRVFNFSDKDKMTAIFVAVLLPIIELSVLLLNKFIVNLFNFTYLYKFDTYNSESLENVKLWFDAFRMIWWLYSIIVLFLIILFILINMITLFFNDE